MLKFAYNKAVDIYRRAGRLASGSYSYSINELNEPVYGDTYTNWQKMSSSLYCRIESARKKEKETEYLPTGERVKGMWLMYTDSSDSHIYEQDRVVDLTAFAGESPSMYIVDKACDEFNPMGKVSHYEIHLTTP